MLLVPYREAMSQIQEADVLLFRGEGLISWLIKRYGSGVHSHAAMAHWDDDDLQCVEFREFKGGRAVSMKSQVATHPNNIDWKNFWKLGKHYLPFCRLAEQNIKDNDPTNVFVCSTAVVYAYRQAYIDPVPYLADSAVTPADLARSCLFEYKFTIQKDW